MRYIVENGKILDTEMCVPLDDETIVYLLNSMGMHVCSCGAEVHDQDRYCANCGSRLDLVASSPL